MELILWRHADATEGAPDDQRILTERGHVQAEKTAQWLKRRLPQQYRVCASEALRSHQTAQYLASTPDIAPLLNPSSSAKDLLTLLNLEDPASTLIWVGHQPWIGQLGYYLLSNGWPRDSYMPMKKGCFWWFELFYDVESRYQARLKAVLAPNMFTL